MAAAGTAREPGWSAAGQLCGRHPQARLIPALACADSAAACVLQAGWGHGQPVRGQRAAQPAQVSLVSIAQQSTLLRRAASITNLNTRGCCRHFELIHSCRCCVRIFAKHSGGLVDSAKKNVSSRSKVKLNVSSLFFSIFCTAYGCFACQEVVMDYFRTSTFTRIRTIQRLPSGNPPIPDEAK